MSFLVRTCSDDDRLWTQLAFGCTDHEPVVDRLKCGHPDALANRCLERARVRLEMRDDRVAGHEAFRVVARVRAAGKTDGPVRGDEAERVPASAPGLADASALQYDVIHTGGR